MEIKNDRNRNRANVADINGRLYYKQWECDLWHIEAKLVCLTTGYFVFKKKREEEFMRPDIDRVQITLGVIYFLGIVIFGIFFLMDNLRIANGIFYGTMLLFLIGFLYTGLRRISKKSKEGVKLAWYKQPWIIASVLMFVSLLMIFISNYTRNFG